MTFHSVAGELFELYERIKNFFEWLNYHFLSHKRIIVTLLLTFFMLYPIYLITDDDTNTQFLNHLRNSCGGSDGKVLDSKSDGRGFDS